MLEKLYWLTVAHCYDLTTIFWRYLKIEFCCFFFGKREGIFRASHHNERKKGRALLQLLSPSKELK